MVEDNYADIDMMKRYLRESVFPITVEVAVDGEDALTVLRQSRDFTAREDPDFILLDINLPKKNGLELLAEIKGDSGLKHIPVVVLSCSSNENDIERAYRNRADLYIVKPENLDQYADVVKSIDDFWIKNKKEEY